MDKTGNMKETEKRIEVMKAYLEGKTIQSHNKKIGGDVWADVKCPWWDWGLYDYRVKPDKAEEPKKIMTCRQLAELLAKGYGECIAFYYDGTSSLVCIKYDYFQNDEENTVKKEMRIRPWGSDEWLEPTVDIYEEFMNNKEKEWRYQNIKISIKKLNGDGFEVESEPDEETIKDYSDCNHHIEPKIGEVFRYKGLTLRCEEGGCGDGCALVKLPCYDFKCIKSERVDRKGVHFVDVSKTENTTASEESSSTQEEGVGVHRRTPQEIADFFNCYVAMDDGSIWYLYKEEPFIKTGDHLWSANEKMEYSNICRIFILVPEDHNWRTLYRPHMEPLVMEEEEDD